jgi:hypothetical protein
LAGRLEEAREAWTRARQLFQALGEDGLAAGLGAQLDELGGPHAA